MRPPYAPNRLLFRLFSLCCVLAAAPSYALPSDQNQPVKLEADRATFNERTGITSYSGNVIISQGTIRIEADNLVVNLDGNRAIKDATAQGRPARFQQQLNADKGLAKGEGSKIAYDAQKGLIVLSGNAQLIQDGASFKGDVLRYSMTQGDIEATGNKQRRVQLVIPPSSNPTSSSAKSQ